jgi:hypothetical protein
MYIYHTSTLTPVEVPTRFAATVARPNGSCGWPLATRARFDKIASDGGPVRVTGHVGAGQQSMIGPRLAAPTKSEKSPIGVILDSRGRGSRVRIAPRRFETKQPSPPIPVKSRSLNHFRCDNNCKESVNADFWLFDKGVRAIIRVTGRFIRRVYSLR